MSYRFERRGFPRLFLRFGTKLKIHVLCSEIFIYAAKIQANPFEVIW